MRRLLKWLYDRRPTRRRLVQLWSALIYNAYIRGFPEGTIYRGKLKGLCVPGLNCYSCPGAVGACPLGSLQNAFAEKGSLWYVLGILMLTGLALGRTVCGYLCPFGLIQELLDKIPVHKIKKGKLTAALSRIKYGILAVFVVGVPALAALKGIQLPAFCKMICPAGTLEGALPLLANPVNEGLSQTLGGLFGWKVIVLLAILVLSIFQYRPFCRFLCPLGALYGLLGRIGPAGITVDETLCTHCDACKTMCPVDIASVGGMECVQCGRCLSACKAIHRKEERFLPASPKKRKRLRRILAGLAALVLTCVLLWVNLAPVRKTQGAVGEAFPSFEARLTDGSVFRPEQGRWTVLNLWATWCAPCMEELPLLQSLKDRGVLVLLIHAAGAEGDPSAVLGEMGITLPCAVDADGSLAAMLGDTGILPRTVVLDPSGTVVYNAPGRLDADRVAQWGN